ncbi:MAG: hypothetical protein K0U98_08450 [Deltaproteobacteria bacterium]|nr:hypothetical protein [Deltaproteobacteria bacterium]
MALILNRFPFSVTVLLATFSGLLWSSEAAALVHYDQGRREIDGVQLLQDTQDPSVYYYLPQYPRLATSADGGFELLCLKYVDSSGGTHGGLFHALVEFTLPEEVIAGLETKLRKQVSGGRIAGPVPLMSGGGEGDSAGSSFRLVSGVLSDVSSEPGSEGFTRSVVTSQQAPITPGSRAAVAAILDQRGATLLWESLSGPTSDVSVALSAYYEASVPSYGARVTAEMETVYRHFSLVSNHQEEFTRRQIRQAIDELERSGGLTVEVFDRAGATGALTSGGGGLDGVLDLVTQKLTELLFDHQTGWAADPEREATVEAGQIQGRQRGGFLSRLFRGAKNRKYYSDDQWVLKNRQDIRRQRFVLDLRRETTLRSPVETSGNLGGLYGALGGGSSGGSSRGESRYFRIVSLEDPAFEHREVHFQLDGDYLEAFEDTVNFVTVNLRKEYPGRPALTRTLTFGRGELERGETFQTLRFPRLGESGADWSEFQFQVRWSLRGGQVLADPEAPGTWLRSSSPAISLAPPLTKKVIEIDVDPTAFASPGVSHGVLEFATFLAGEAAFRRPVVLRPAARDGTVAARLYFDRGRPVVYRLSWYGPAGERRGPAQPLDSEYLYLVAPEASEAPEAPESLEAVPEPSIFEDLTLEGENFEGGNFEDREP